MFWLEGQVDTKTAIESQLEHKLRILVWVGDLIEENLRVGTVLGFALKVSRCPIMY